MHFASQVHFKYHEEGHFELIMVKAFNLKVYSATKTHNGASATTRELKIDLTIFKVKDLRPFGCHSHQVTSSV